MCTGVLIYTHAQIGTYTPCAHACTCSHIQAETEGGRERGREEQRIYYLQKRNELTDKKLDRYILEIFSQ